MTTNAFLPQYSVGLYRSKDPIKNFKIKVSLNRVTNSSIKDYAEDFESKDGVQLREIKKLQDNLMNEASQHDKEEVVIQWQTKIFSKSEYAKYTSEMHTPKTMLETYYVEECKKLKEKNYQPQRIFTYIDSDPFQYSEEIGADITDISDKEIPTYLKRNEANLRKRKPMIGNVKINDVSVPRVNIVNYSIQRDDKKALIPSQQYHIMYIMADLSPKTSLIMRKVEVLLCVVKVNSNGTILVKPDFNDFKKPYIVETGGFANEVYEYIIENASPKIGQENLFRELKLHQELYARHKDFVKNLVGTEFLMPPPKVLNVYVFGEIISAKNFDYDDLHVYYQLDLPKNWYVDQSKPISGFTTTSRTVCIERDEIAYFSHPFEFELFYENDEINENYKDEIPQMPKIYFEIASYDSWNRYRTEGYTWTQINSKPGIQKEDLPCWRPRGDSFIYELRRFFIGGSPELEDISYVAIPSNHEHSILSRFGFRTVTTGTLSIKMNILFQSQIFLDKNVHMRKHVHLLNKIGDSSKLNDLMAVLVAFHHAKNRMKEATETSGKVITQANLI